MRHPETPVLTLATVLLPWLVAGCATISEPAWKPVFIESDPPGASVYLNDKPAGMTPLTVQVPTQEHAAITLFKHGLPAKTVVVLTEPNRAAAVDILFWPLFLVDLIEDRYRVFPADHISVRLGEGPRAILYNDNAALVDLPR